VVSEGQGFKTVCQSPAEANYSRILTLGLKIWRYGMMTSRDLVMLRAFLLPLPADSTIRPDCASVTIFHEVDLGDANSSGGYRSYPPTLVPNISLLSVSVIRPAMDPGGLVSDL
jgi:hypothetical protein